MSEKSPIYKDLVGGYYDAGDAIKFNFPSSFAMTMLSWSVIEYTAKYEAAGELNHIKEIIKWGTDYFLKTFNNSADTIDRVVAQVELYTWLFHFFSFNRLWLVFLHFWIFRRISLCFSACSMVSLKIGFREKKRPCRIGSLQCSLTLM